MRQRLVENYYKQRLNAVLIYIQDNIQSNLTLDRLAEVASISPFHFHRIFSAQVGESLHAYIKRLRLENAAFRLCHTRESVTDIAFSSGYSSLAAFTKAFSKHFGETPNAVRSQRSLNKNGKSDEWSSQNFGAQLEPPEFHTISDQIVLFVRRTGDYQEAARSAWESLMQYAYTKNLFEHGEVTSIGITYDSPDFTNEEFVRYDACLALGNELIARYRPDQNAEVGVQTLKGGHYAVFEHTGPYESLWMAYKAIYGEWLQSNNISLRNSPSFARYVNSPSDVLPEYLKTQIFIPVELQ